MNVASLRSRFALAMLAWVAGGLLAVGLSAVALFRTHVEGVFHDELEEHLVELIGLSEVDAHGRPVLARPLSDPRYGAEGSGYYWQIDRPGAPLLRSPSLGTNSLDSELAHEEGLVKLRAPGPSGPAMIYGMTRPASGNEALHYLVATDVRHLDDLVAGFRRDLLLWLAALAALLLLGAALALRFATRPLDRLAAAVAAVRTGRARRMGEAWPLEIAPLASDLDRLLDSREAMVSAARIEAGNLAHGLRTSLAVLTDEAETLADQPAGKPSGATLLAECARMARQLDWHLARARVAAGGAAVRAADVAQVVAALLTAMRRLHQTRGVIFEASGDGSLSVAFDPEDLFEVLSNLLDNGGKWACGEVVVQWHTAGNHGVIEIVDDGPGIAAEDAARLGQPGVRLDERVDGHGLGLAIARDLVTRAGGTLETGARADGAKGLVVRVTLPLGEGA